jgi:UDP-N-acetylmuramate: L-alanyl-gamma-D-glutamyl-meso-diaminopimelate ligase
MANLAAMLQERGFRVTGSDENVYPPMSDFLRERGIEARIGYRAENLDDDVDLVVIGNALSRGNPEVETVLDRGVPFRSFPEILRDWFLEGRRSIVVTGTHGKTTTASMIAWILHRLGRDPTFLIGGIPVNFGQGYHLGEGPEAVLEGDEYDTAFFDKRPKFVHYRPWIVTLGALEYDHADIYPDMRSLFAAFEVLLRVIPRGGRLVIHEGDPQGARLAQKAPCRVVSCSLERGGADWRAEDIQIQGGQLTCRILHQDQEVGRIRWRIPGRHNLLNALVALAAVHEAGIGAREALDALRGFRGVRRRMEFLGERGGVYLYDDFAHHPTAIRSTLEALRDFYPHGRLWAVVEPRSNTLCRRVFQDELPLAMEVAQVVMMGAVHRADRIPPRERLQPERVIQEVRRMGKEGHYIPDVSAMAHWIVEQSRPGDVVCFMSNGAFGGIQEMVREGLSQRSGERIRGWRSFPPNGEDSGGVEFRPHGGRLVRK